MITKLTCYICLKMYDLCEMKEHVGAAHEIPAHRVVVVKTPDSTRVDMDVPFGYAAGSSTLASTPSLKLQKAMVVPTASDRLTRL